MNTHIGKHALCSYFPENRSFMCVGEILHSHKHGMVHKFPDFILKAIMKRWIPLLTHVQLLTSTTVSSFGAIDFSTSSFSLLSIIGFRMSWSFCTSVSVFRAPNSWRKASLLENCVGSRKLSRENSSFTLFWRGVPDNRTRCSCNMILH